MQRVFTCFLAALVLTHAVFGCCVHHAHACDLGCCDAPTAQATECPCGQHASEQVAKPAAGKLAKRSHHDQDSHRCEGTTCTFLATKTSPRDWGDPSCTRAANGGFVAAAAAVVKLRPTAAAGAPLGKPSSALRWHLILSVLLI